MRQFGSCSHRIHLSGGSQWHGFRCRPAPEGRRRRLPFGFSSPSMGCGSQWAVVVKTVLGSTTLGGIGEFTHFSFPVLVVGLDLDFDPWPDGSRLVAGPFGEFRVRRVAPLVLLHGNQLNERSGPPFQRMVMPPFRKCTMADCWAFCFRGFAAGGWGRKEHMCLETLRCVRIPAK